MQAAKGALVTHRPWPDDPASHDEETSVMSRAEVHALIRTPGEAAPDEITADATEQIREAEAALGAFVDELTRPVAEEDELTPDEHDEYASRARSGRPVTWMILAVSLAGALLAGHAFQRCTANTHSVEAPGR